MAALKSQLNLLVDGSEEKRQVAGDSEHFALDFAVRIDDALLGGTTSGNGDAKKDAGVVYEQAVANTATANSIQLKTEKL